MAVFPIGMILVSPILRGVLRAMVQIQDPVQAVRVDRIQAGVRAAIRAPTQTLAQTRIPGVTHADPMVAMAGFFEV